GEATVAGIENAIADATTERQRTDLMNQRTQALIDQQVDLARQPTVAWALEPQDPINGNSKKGGAIGLVIGALLGAALAFARGSRRRCIDDRLDPAAFYGAPLIGETPTSTKKKRRSRTAPVGLLPMTTRPRSVDAEAFRFAAGSIGRICAARGQRLSLAFVSAADAGRSAVVANVALAIAESGTRVLAIDADAGDLTALLLPDTPVSDGFEQVLAGQRPAADCVEPSPLHRGVSVLRSGRTTRAGVTSAAYSKAVEKVFAEAKASFDVVLVDSPALLRVAHASELVDASDATIVVVGPHEPIQDHLDMVDRLDLIESEVVGYIYSTAPKRSRLAHPPGRSSARSGRRAISSVVLPSPAFEGTHSRDGDDYPSAVLEAGR
ncbi:MAG: AAA family ATPase, partial [Nocardioidaceae bacterium]